MTKLLVRDEEQSYLEDDRKWFPGAIVRCLSDLRVIHKTDIPEAEISALTSLRVAIKERDRIYKAMKKAFKFLPGTSLLGGAIVAATSGGTEVIPSST